MDLLKQLSPRMTPSPLVLWQSQGDFKQELLLIVHWYTSSKASREGFALSTASADCLLVPQEAMP